MDDIKKALVSAGNESTSAPYWLILDPRQNMSCGVHLMASGISGPFFCRKDAQYWLDSRSYHFSERARVYCMSGHKSNLYVNLCKKAGI